ncbi:MAG TPA: nucleic acid-binding protein [Candidatus Luteococcus avicola]|uniref:Zinc ribbon domain-containing protein n=1 Tax=Luteococcus sanguinis TaxID=174038 RepID=A0ABW1X1X0_9ACTN|nr:nucleic acid-binding protein [Candidatus Luteococcus avicola]
MRAEPAAQLRLLDLAAIDSEIARLTHRRKTLPELAQIEQLMAQRATLVEEQVAAETRLGDAEGDQARIEADLDPTRARLERNQQRVDSGSVTDTKALAGLVDEIEHLKRRIGKLEDQELDAMEVIENLTHARDKVSSEREALETRIRELMTRRNDEFAAIDAQVADRTSERDAQRRLVPTDLMGLYDKIAARSGLGAAALKARRCTGCQLEANAADLRRYADAAPDEVLRCEECDRILVRTKESGLPE